MTRQEHRIQFRKSGKFLAAGLDRPNQLDASGEFSFCAHRHFGRVNLWMLRCRGRMRADLPDGQRDFSF
ncbi:hypothetical protein LQG66_03225 [Bradyrhizobium ontarionense]|uniref:Uncharacterized protein n=1 Tax=Bradyrhizobium ontarionense TaxID=2898149 RepID=A0ABY3REZ5_9BRAD|nr:hypothetical protein [Bradyrhizobium sp. A19]UFZ05347.1 hypothetical protein LQG66_03225 [Bradyrhizobium sp. A19]